MVSCWQSFSVVIVFFSLSADVVDPIGDVTRFIETYNESYGGTHPVFYQGTYSQVIDVC